MGSQSVSFLLDTGIIYSVLIDVSGPLSPWSTTVMGLSGWPKHNYFSCPLSCNWDSVLFSHEFLIVPESPSPLLGRDILSKVHASVFMIMEPSLSLPLIEQNVNPRVWADGKTQNCGSSTNYSCSYQAQRPTLISTSKTVFTKAQG